MNVLVRPATAADLPATLSIYNEDIPTTTSTWRETPQTLAEREEWFSARSARGFPTLVAELSGAVVGVAAFGDFRDSVRWTGYRFAVEHSVHVTESCWGKGIGRKLMDALFDAARERNVHAMIGGIDGANVRSLAFHERLGFREVARMPEVGFKFGRWCDLVLVERLMDAPGAPR
ncbi:MAG TPA: GNAT family N-acetyltransferase [Polyangiaceae bacterium]|nr:GNAT family N-acetyltransferase [Polyangiaceae bacterium]